MSYVGRTLGPAERIVFSTGYHWLVWLEAALLCAPALAIGIGGNPHSGLELAALALATIVLPYGLYLFGRAVSTEIVVTTDRFVRKTGLVSYDTEEIGLANVETVLVEQTILGRLLGYGTVRVHGEGRNWIEIKMVELPVRLRRQLQFARESRRAKVAVAL